MIANLYLHTESFKYNGKDSLSDVVDKLKNLIKDLRDIIYQYSNENIFKIPTEMFSCPVYKTQTIVEFAAENLDGEQCSILYSMFANTSDDYSINYEDLRQKCQYCKNEIEVNSIVVLNCENVTTNKSTYNQDAYIQFDNYEIVYNRQSWKTLRRQILGNHPGTPQDFITECRKYFDILYINDNCVKSLSSSNFLETIPRKIIYYLSCLNDVFFKVKERHTKQDKDANSILEDFSGEFGLDEPGSLERNPQKKPSLTFLFNIEDETKNNHIHKILCEPHLKISKADDNYSSSTINYRTFHPRIYFNFDHPDFPGKIFIGSIGPHL